MVLQEKTTVNIVCKCDRKYLWLQFTVTTVDDFRCANLHELAVPR